MDTADRADGDYDGKIQKGKALDYIDALIGRAQVLGCSDEVARLELVKAVTQKIRKDVFDSPNKRFVPDYLIDRKLTSEMQAHAEGRALLKWDDTDKVECPRMDYALPKPGRTK